MSHRASLPPDLSSPPTAWPFSEQKEERIPPLMPGDRLTVAEFERRYEAMPNLKKAELINGVVYMSSLIDERHGQPHAQLMTMLGVYQFQTPNVLLGDNSSVKGLQGEHEPQPDCVLRIAPECGGQTATDEIGYIQGAPELVAEVAYSSKSYDLHDKKEAFRENGVREYVVWCVEDREVLWFRLVDEQYEPMKPEPDGILKSEVFPGLWLDAAALVNGDLPRAFEVVLQASPRRSIGRSF